MSQKTRTAFTSKFQSLSNTFEIQPKSLNEFLRGYEQQYIKAVKEMQNEKFAFSLRDNRSVQEYMYDLCEGWIMEDLISWKLQQLLKEQGDYKVEMNGCEVTASGRQISTSKITSKSDLIISSKHKSLKLEIQFANNDRDFYNIKETKIKQACREKALIFVYSLPLAKGFLVDCLSPVHMKIARLESNPAWGGKQAYRFFKRDLGALGGFISLNELTQKVIEEVK